MYTGKVCSRPIFIDWTQSTYQSSTRELNGYECSESTRYSYHRQKLEKVSEMMNARSVDFNNRKSFIERNYEGEHWLR